MKVKKLSWILPVVLFVGCKPDNTLTIRDKQNQFSVNQNFSSKVSLSPSPSPGASEDAKVEVSESEANDDLSFSFQKTIRKLERLICSNVDDLYYLGDELAQKMSPKPTQEVKELQKLFSLQRSELFDEIEPVYFQCQQAKTDTQKTECIYSYRLLVETLEARFEKEYHDDVLHRKQKHRFYQGLISYLTLSNPFLNFFSKIAGPTPPAPDSYSQMSDHFWGQNIVASDLARKFIHHYYGNFSNLNSDLNIAVLDSFSILNTDSFHSTVQSGEISDSSDDPIAISDHGSTVTSFITGKSEIGGSNLSIPLTYYPAQNTGNRAIGLKICKQLSKTGKITLINMSIGPSTTADLEFFSSSTFKEMAKMGCLVINAGGNEGHLNNGTEYSLADSFLRVEAADNWGDRVFLSTRGEIPAPGYDVWGFSEKQGNQRCNPHDSTRNERCDFTQGTSFAAPIVTGIAIQVAHVLNAGTKFSNLLPERRVALVAAILKASTDAYPNALRAIRIAELWNSASSRLDPLKENGEITFQYGKWTHKFDLLKADAPSILRSYLKKWPAPICTQKNPPNCSSLLNKSPDGLAQCIDQEREHLAFCDDSNSPQVALDLVKIYLNQGKDHFAYSVASDVLTRFNPTSPISQEIIGLTVKHFFNNLAPIKKFLDPIPGVNREGRRFWRHYFGNKLSPGLMRQFIQPYLDSFKGRSLDELMPRHEFEDLIDGVIHSYNMQYAFALYPDKATEIQELLHPFVQTVISFLGKDEGKQILLESITSVRPNKYRQFLEEIVNTAPIN